ncbi:MAG: glutamyl-tRNA reductase [Clostridia bacterium]|nr:glutamyl-tRNA reductase [Clostridia bacterium]
MAIIMAGIDHKKASLDVRSTFSLTKRRIEEFYTYIKERTAAQGCVLLSTCNRMEVWMSLDESNMLSPTNVLCSFLNADHEQYRTYFSELSGNDAVLRLFRVACGLESRIIGEDQIITQVREALAFARSNYATDHTLEVLFRCAVTAAKRVKTETKLSSADRSVIHTALDLLKSQGIDTGGKKCLVIGNGMMGKLSAQALLDRGADVTVTVRQYHSGIVDIPSGCHRIDYQKRFEALPECELVVSATSSPNYTLRMQELQQLMPKHKICMIDLAVPRDIEQEAAELPWLTLYDTDSFRIDPQSEQLKTNIESAEKIISEELAAFYEWYDGKNFVPMIQHLKETTGSDVSGRMVPALRNIPLDDEEKHKLSLEIEAASSRMMNRLLFGLRAKLSDDTLRECLNAMEEIMSKPL